MSITEIMSSGMSIGIAERDVKLAELLAKRLERFLVPEIESLALSEMIEHDPRVHDQEMHREITDVLELNRTAEPIESSAGPFLLRK